MSHEKILIVEDEIIVAKDLESRLTTLGYSIAGIARTAEKAVAAVRARKVDLVLMDVRLGGRMRGTTAAERIQREHHVPVIFLGGASDEKRLKSAGRSGHYGFLIKPIGNNRDLRNAIEIALTKHVMEGKLHESGDFFRILFNESPIAIVLSDLSSGAIVYTNQKFQILLGRPEKEIIGRTAADLGLLHDPRDQERLTAMLRTKGVVEDLEVKSNAPRGGIGVNLISMRVINLLGKPHGLISVQDITERKKAAEALRNSEHRYQELIESARDAIFSLSPEGSFTSMNKAFENITGWTIREWIGKPYTDLLHPDDIPKALDRLSRLMRGRTGEALELRIRKKTGGYITGEVLGSLQVIDGRISGILCVGRDISERKRIEERLKLSIEEKTRAEGLLLALSESSRKILNVRTPEGVFQAIGDEIVKLGYQATLLTLTPDRKHLQVSNMTFQSRLIRAAERLTGIRSKGYRFPPRPHGIFQRLIASGTAELVELDRSSIAEALPAKMRSLAGRLQALLGGTRAIFMPLKVDAEVHSLMTVIGADLTEAALPAFQTFANQAGIALENALLYQAAQQEINERNRVEEALRQSENRYRTTIDALADSVHVVGPDLRFVLVNEGFRTWNGRLGLQTDAIGKDLFEVFPFLPARVRAEYRIVFRSGKTLDSEETFRIGDDEIVTETRKTPILEKGKVIRVVTVIRDVTQKKRAETALFKSEEKFSKAFRTSPIPMAITRLKDRRGIEVNESFERIMGFQRNEVIGRTGLELNIWVNPKEFDFVFETLAKKGRIHDQEYRFRTKDGIERIFRYSAVTIELEGEACILVSAVDLTDIKRIETKIHESEEKYRTLIETTDTGYVILDSQGKVLDANIEYVRLSGHKKLGDILGRKVEEWTAGHDRERNAEAVRQCLKRGFVRNLTVDYADQRGKTVPIEINATVIQAGGHIQIMSLCRDISERKAAEAALQESESKFRLLFETSRDFLYRTALDGKIIDVNAAAGELSGYSLDELKKMSMLELYADPAEREVLVRKISEKGFVENFEIKGKRKDGTILDVLVTSILIRGKDSRPEGFQGSIKDITERKRAETALLKSEEKFSKAFQTSPVAMDIMRLKDRQVIEVNEAFERISGFSRGEIIGRTTRELNLWLNTEDQDFVFRTLKNEGRVVNQVFRFRVKDGSIKTANYSAEIIELGGEPCILVSLVDLTDLKKAEEEIRESERKVRAIFDLSFEFIGLLTPDGTLLDANRTALEFAGVALADVKGKPFWETPWWSHSTEMKDLIRNSVKIAADGKLVRSEAIHRAKDGTLHTIDFSLKPIMNETGKVILLIPEGRDITERKQSEEALQLQNRLQELLMNMSSTYINQPLETIESAIRVSLGELAEFVGADRSYIFDADFDRQVSSNTHEWCGEGIEPTIDQFQDAPMAPVQDLVDVLRRGESFSVQDVRSMPPGVLRDIVERGSVKSFLNVPMMSSGECIGFVGFDWVRQHHSFSHYEQRLLTVFANMLVNIWNRKRAETTLQQSENRFRALIENSTDMVRVLDQSGVVTYVSPSVQRIMGYLPKELIGRSAFELIHPEDLPFVKEAWQASAQVSGPIPMVIEARVRHADGTWHNHEAIGTNLLAEPSLRGFVMNSRDITERKQAEKSLQLSASQLKANLENTPNVAIQWYDETGRVLYWNRASETLYGWKAEEAVGKTLDMLIQSQEDAAEFLRILDGIRLTGKPYGPYETSIRHRDGSPGYVMATTFSIPMGEDRTGFVCMDIDITERRKAEEALKESEERMRLLANAAFEGIGISDRGRVAEANDQLARMLGYCRDELLGMPVMEMVAPESRELVAQHIREGSEQPYEHLALRKDGSVVSVEVQSRTIPYKGHPARVTAIRDITEQKKAREIMENAQRTLRLASVGTLAAGISHEINQPLTALKMKVDGMLFWGEQDTASLSKNIVPNLEFISAKAGKIDEIIRHMRSLIQREKTPPRFVDLNESVQRALSVTGQQLASHNIYLNVRLGGGRIEVLANETSVEQVVINLVTNAMNALDTMDLDYKRIRVATRPTASAGILLVSDNGPGIPEQNLNRIFNPLFTTEPSGTGMGLGLSIVQFLVQEYKGIIRVKNRASGGAAFLVAFPSTVKPSSEVS
jgi:PAS domain S-box-containing protein